MVANPDKFKAIVIMKHDDQTAGIEFNFSGSGRTIYRSRPFGCQVGYETKF